MSDLNKYVRRPEAQPSEQQGRYEIYNLKDNPFPAQPFVNPDFG